MCRSFHLHTTGPAHITRLTPANPTYILWSIEPVSRTVNPEEPVNPGLEPHLAGGLRLLQKAVVIHVLGGGFANALWPHNLLVLEAARAAGHAGNARVAITGQGLLPTPDDSSWIDVLGTIAADVEVFDVRDHESAELLRAFRREISISGDDAWLSLDRRSRVYSKIHRAAQRRWVFVVQSDLTGDTDTSDATATARISEELQRLIVRWGIRGDDTAFLEGIPRTDRHAYDQFRPLLPGALFVPFDELWNTGFPARSGQVWICSRFHFHLLAAAAGADGVVLPGRGDYYPIKHASLIDAGSQWTRLADTGAHPPNIGGFTPQTVHALHTAKLEVAGYIYRNI